MRTPNQALVRATIAVLVLVGLIAYGPSCSSNSSSSKPTTEPAAPEVASYDSPDAALAALLSAMRANDNAKLQYILGPDADDILSSGDAVADLQRRTLFLNSYDQKHSFTTNPDGSVTLVIGNQEWPLPIPIVKDIDSQKWFFDTDAGKDEILSRRIGNNELNVILVCNAIGDAEEDYAHADPDGNGIPEYAAKVLSDPGKHNGLYWHTEPGQPPSPLGEFVAAAVAEGYSVARPDGATDTGPRPYHGYLYRLLTAQGEHAPGGAMDYMVNGKLIGGFAAVAFPADYGNSGIMTFMVNHDGIVYEKDLGEETDKLARAINVYDPDPTWKKVDDAPKP